MDGEQFVIGMAASELSYIKEEEALKAWMIVCRTNFVKAASGESNSKKVGSETDMTVAQKTRNIANAASTQNSGNTTNVVGIQNSNNVKDVQSTEIINRKYQNIRQENLNLDYISMKELEENNGRKAYLEIKKKLEDASDATFGQVLTYENKYADALYHEVSIGKQFLQKNVLRSRTIFDQCGQQSGCRITRYMDVKVLPYDEVLQNLQKQTRAEILQKQIKARI